MTSTPKKINIFIGPSNSGKTSFFKNSFINGKIISVLDMKDLDINISNDNFLNLRTMDGLAKNEKIAILKKFSSKNCSHLMLDECHFFKMNDFLLLNEIFLEHMTLYINLLTGTWNNTQFLFDDDSNKRMAYLDFLQLYYFSKTKISVFIFEKPCELCQSVFTISSFKRENLNEKILKHVGKRCFFPCCNKCKNFSNTRNKFHFTIADNIGSKSILLNVIRYEDNFVHSYKVSNFFEFLNTMHLYDSIDFK